MKVKGTDSKRFLRILEMTINIDSLFRNADPIISEILNNALSEKEISAKEGLELYKTKGIDFHLVGLVADELRKRRVGNIVSYVVNRNKSFVMQSDEIVCNLRSLKICIDL